VIRQSPARGEGVASGSAVALLVSRGRPPGRSCVGSPTGSVEPPWARVDSPAGDLYARQVVPYDTGRIGLFDRRTDRRLRVVHFQEIGNPLKGICWSPRGELLGVMYHHDPGSYVALVDPRTGNEQERTPVAGCPHSLFFSRNGAIQVAGDEPC
jgi:hypothetical protein